MVVNAWGQQVAKDTLRKATSQERDSTFYTNLKNKMNKSSVGREIYNFLFRDVYNSNASRQVQTIEVNPFLEHEGKVIRHIVIRQQRPALQNHRKILVTTRRVRRFRMNDEHPNHPQHLLHRAV